MRPTVFRLDTRAQQKPAVAIARDALAHLAALLPRLKLPERMPEGEHTKSPTHLELRSEVLQALVNEVGSENARRLLSKLGLTEPRSLDWREALRRALSAPDGALGRLWHRLGGVHPEDKDDEASRQWHLDLCNARSSYPPAPDEWGDIKVGLIDTGYTDHPALGLPGDSWVDVKAARSFDGLSTQPGRDRMRGGYAGHGTSSASVVAGFDEAAGFYGVAPCVPLVPVRATLKSWVTPVAPGLAALAP